MRIQLILLCLCGKDILHGICLSFYPARSALMGLVYWQVTNGTGTFPVLAVQKSVLLLFCLETSFPPPPR